MAVLQTGSVDDLFSQARALAQQGRAEWEALPFAQRQLEVQEDGEDHGAAPENEGQGLPLG